MSPASYLAAPPRGANPQYSHDRARPGHAGRYDRPVPWYAYVCLGVFVVLVAAGPGVLVASLVRLGRSTSRFQRTLAPATEELERSAAGLEGSGRRLAERQAAFVRGQERAQASYRGLLVLWAALGEVRLGLRLLRLALARR